MHQKRFKFTLDSPLCKTIQTKADPLTFTITLKCQFIYILFNISAFALSHQHHCHPPQKYLTKQEELSFSVLFDVCGLDKISGTRRVYIFLIYFLRIAQSIYYIYFFW